MAIENWQQMVGRDRRALVEKPEECQQLCASNPDCLFWTYKSDVIKPAGSTGGGVIGVAGTDSNCLNKANQENMTPNSDFVSGSKTLFVFHSDDPQQNVNSFLTSVFNTVFYALSHGTFLFSLHGSSKNQ